ncbi:hypothetical protein CkaCkLH20_02626 [Colletotrichum karsti]|uniref:Uncharacterized protein n=1 Tax=Colletotrichum karsti TaxID=1095194 RepID=A0A9P6IBX7_9PEZI|nr:uncharacterized protein CkaCkLH20_02626 [Colletotrichum karsti]KAF9879815.1 hypothetical protein CkaCkLH20_02626 [Colletotrichum karsti]
MHSTQLLAAALSVAAFVAAAPQIQQGRAAVPPLNCPATICIDGINTACPSVRWGGCYDACRPSLSPTQPPCPKPTKPTKSITKMPGKPSPRPVSPPKPSSTDNCNTRTICIDYVNECGQWYGGCHADCRPWPSYTAPPCSSTAADQTYSLPYITSEAEQTYSLPFMTAEPEPEQTYSLPYFPA